MALPSHSLLVILTHQAAVWHEQVVGDGEAIHHTLQQHLHQTQKPKRVSIRRSNGEGLPGKEGLAMMSPASMR